MSIMMQLCEISIHALLAESDFEAGRAGMQAALFLSTLSLRRATSTSAKRWMPTEFLSTLSLRRATAEIAKTSNADTNFYPRSPCGERPVQIVIIVMHALFLSTLSLRRATPSKTRRLTNLMISIHALLAESDYCWPYLSSLTRNFYPRSPCGERPSWFAWLASYVNFYPRSPCGERLLDPLKTFVILAFLSTLSLRRATRYRIRARYTKRISIHALLAESDTPRVLRHCTTYLFLSTLSLRRATLTIMLYDTSSLMISIHALLAESDVSLCYMIHRR